MTALKILGFVLVAASGGFFGYLKAEEIKNHTRILEALHAALGFIKNEIAFRQAPLPRVFSALSGDSATAVGQFFGNLAQTIEQEPFFDAWLGAVKKLPLKPDEQGALFPLGEVLGKYDAQKQGAEIEHAREAVLEYIERSKSREAQTGKNLAGLGLSLGATLAVILM